MTPPSPSDDAPAPPSAPRTSRTIAGTPFYYGWVVLAAAVFAMFMTLPGQTAGISVFLDKIIEDLAISRTQVSFLYAVATLIGASSLAFVGRAIDRFGPRWGVGVIAVAFGLACMGMALVVGPVTLLVGFTLIRLLGQGSLQLVSFHAVNQWFVRRRGLAVGLTGLGIAIGTAAFPPVIEWLLALGSWRSAYLVLGAVVLLVLVPVAITFFRASPETFGLSPDGEDRRGGSAPARPERNLPARVAVRTMTFWLYTAGGVGVSGLGTALVFHHYGIMADNGLERSEAATMFVAFGLIMAGANLLSGYLMDRVPPRFLLAADQALLCAALVGGGFVSAAWLVPVYGAVLGTAQGMHSALQAGVYAHYFGRRHYGAIKGIATTVSIAGTAVGPWLFALGFDLTGSTVTTLVACAALPLVVGLAAPFLRPAASMA